MNKKAFNGTVQVPRPVALIRAFGQQELPDFFADTKEKRPVCCADQRGLALFGARSEALLQAAPPQGAEDYQLVQWAQAVCQTGMHYFVDSKRHLRSIS